MVLLMGRGPGDHQVKDWLRPLTPSALPRTWGVSMEPRNPADCKSGSSNGEPDRPSHALLSVRSALVLTMAVLVGLFGAALLYGAHRPSALIAVSGLGSFGGALKLLDSMIKLRALDPLCGSAIFTRTPCPARVRERARPAATRTRDLLLDSNRPSSSPDAAPALLHLRCVAESGRIRSRQRRCAAPRRARRRALRWGARPARARPPNSHHGSGQLTQHPDRARVPSSSASIVRLAATTSRAALRAVARDRLRRP